MLHRWYDSEMAIYTKNLEVNSVIAIDVQHPERSIVLFCFGMTSDGILSFLCDVKQLKRNRYE